MPTGLQPYLLTSPPARRHSLRLSLTPRVARTGAVDGAWWPYSMDPLAEFPAVIAGLAMCLGPVTRLTYNLDAWGPGPWCLVVDSETVRLDGFHSIDPHTVRVSGQTWGSRVLLIVPPDTRAYGATTEQILHTAEPR
ncbi:DUF5994 family protein [Actinocrispum sp. NPDC049592]|uniref:DUF5994 family protein n=1 Tax=Actinocrispum sp. NPDC049592 TaxID=3154835 RepID=UPI00342D3BFB